MNFRKQQINNWNAASFIPKIDMVIKNENKIQATQNFWESLEKIRKVDKIHCRG